MSTQKLGNIMCEFIAQIHNQIWYLKGRAAKFSSFDMLIDALDGAFVQSLCPVPHFNTKL